MMRWFPVLALLAACGGSKLDAAIVRELFFKTDGIIGGYAPGDAWSAIKAGHDPRLTVADKEGAIDGKRSDLHQLRMDLGPGPGDNGVYFQFRLDGDRANVVIARAFGEGDNRPIVHALSEEAFHYLGKKLGAEGTCQTAIDAPFAPTSRTPTSCVWRGNPHVELRRFQNVDGDGSTMLEVEVTK